MRRRPIVPRCASAINFLSAHVRDQGYGLRFAIEPKPNEPRGDIFLPTVGHALHFITILDHPEMVGVNPEVAHETMAGLSFVHGVSQALWAGKLFHIDLNSQRIGRYDQDFRFGAEDLKEAFLLVHLLETSGYDGPRHFDAHAYRSEDPDGVWDFAAGCMRTYLALAAKSRQFLASDAIRAAREASRVDELAESSVGPYSASVPRSCSPRITISTRWPGTATAWSASTSSSSSCCWAPGRRSEPDRSSNRGGCRIVSTVAHERSTNRASRPDRVRANGASEHDQSRRQPTGDRHLDRAGRR